MSRTVVSAESVEKIVQTSAAELIILDGIDLEINQGETVAVVGASGSGKTTLLGILAGLDTATAGAVKLLDANLTDLDEELESPSESDSFLITEFIDRTAGDEFHHEEGITTCGGARIDHRSERGMAHHGQSLPLRLEPNQDV